MTIDVLRSQLSRLLGTDIEELRRLTGGASRETWSFDVVDADGSRNGRILRRDPPAAARTGGMAMEAALFKAAAEAGVPVPTIRASGESDPDLLDTSFLIMDRINGETIARKILRDDQYITARRSLPSQLGEALAKLHSIPVATVPGLPTHDPLAKYRAVLDDLGYSSPVFEYAFRWLADHRPEPSRPVIVHGDFRLGNVIVDESGLTSVLDWELAHVGDPHEDMGWLCVRAWRFGGSFPVAGVGAYDEFFRAYESAGGFAPNPETVKWWETLGTLIWGIMCVTQATAHTSGAIRSVELAAIGRRVCEQEHDLLDCLGIASLPAGSALTDAVASTAESLAGLPSAPDLSDALRQYLMNDVIGATTGRVQFHARVAANVVSILERELALGPTANHRYAQAVAKLGVRNERDLSEAIRSGLLDGNGDLWLVLRQTVDDRLSINNPKYR